MLKMVRADFGVETPPSLFLSKNLKLTAGQGELHSVLPPYPTPCIESWPAQGTEKAGAP